MLLFFIGQGSFKPMRDTIFHWFRIDFKIDGYQRLIGRKEINLLLSIFWEKNWCPLTKKFLILGKSIVSKNISLLKNKSSLCMMNCHERGMCWQVDPSQTTDPPSSRDTVKPTNNKCLRSFRLLFVILIQCIISMTNRQNYKSCPLWMIGMIYY